MSSLFHDQTIYLCVPVMLGIILGIVLFMFLVLIHELGHFTAAKKTGVKVLEFGIGIPPKIKKLRTDKQGTEYTANWIPLGGFVRLKGEDPNDTKDFRAPDSFISASVLSKILILIAGVAVNTLFAWLAFSAAFWHGIYPLNIIPDSMVSVESRSYLMPTRGFLEDEGMISVPEEGEPALIDDVMPDSAAATIGLQAGDEIVTIAGEEITASNLGSVLKDNIGEDIIITVQRPGGADAVAPEQIEYEFSCPTNGCFLGVVLQGSPATIAGPITFKGRDAFGAGWHEVVAQTDLTFAILGSLGRNLFSFNQERISSSVNRLSGPVGIVKFGEGVFVQGGFWPFLAFGGMISLALAIFNILPIPALDGGRILGVLIQETGRFKPEKYFVIENYINMFFFVILMVLGVYIILLDLERARDVPIPFIGG